MSVRNRPQFQPTLVALEERVVPAWWTVFAVDTAAGTPGDGTATVSGDLTLAPALDPNNTGQATIQADTAEAAIGSAVTGFIRIADGSNATDLGFSADQVGTAAQQRPFAVALDGDWATISLEGSAPWAGATYAYDDQSWLVRITPAESPSPAVVPPPAPTPVGVGGAVDLGSTDPWKWHGHYDCGPEDGSATVALAVTRYTEDTYHWKYIFTNDTMSAVFNSPGARTFSLNMPDASVVSNMTTSLGGWLHSTSGGLAEWHSPSNGVGPFVPKGGQATFEFDTPPVPVVPGTGGAEPAPIQQGRAWIVNGAGPGGDAKVPGVPLTAKLESVKFTSGPSGTTSFWIDEDPNDAPYIKNFHWLDEDLTG